jgi:hypothetical protein
MFERVYDELMLRPAYVRAPPASRADPVVAPAAIAFREECVVAANQLLGPPHSRVDVFIRLVAATLTTLRRYPAAP